jgi:hypothetical protein
MQVRCAVNTGPVLVRPRARPETGEGVLVGDAVNTCARLLAEAPAMATVVGELTRRLTARVVSYEDLPPRAVKGKAEPVQRWVARGPVARKGIGAQPSTPMIGRRRHLGVLEGLLSEAQVSRRPQHVLVTGEAGVGKTRLVQEFYRRVDERPGFFCTWRQGGCPAYGESLAYWGLGEIVAGHAGILQSDPPSLAEEKLARSLGRAGHDEWLLGRLRPLVGLPGVPTDREDSFSAWLRFIAGLTEDRPAVLVFEDIHWASEPMLSFLARLVDDLTNAPLLLVLTARPEFYDHSDGVLDVGKLERIDLHNLAPQEAVRLARGLADSADIPDLDDLVVENCGGNPLFIEEFIRYAVDQQTVSGIPATLQTLIASRLDALSPAQRETLSDAAIVGQVFWPGALAALDGKDRINVESILEDLCAREFLVAMDGSGIEPEREYSFRHALIRDVAYARLSRAARATRHAAVAEWLDRMGEPRDTFLELRAFHFAAAHRLSTAVRDEQLAERLRLPAMSALKEAGDRTLSTDVAGAERLYCEASLLSRPADALHAHLMLGMADLRMQQARYDEAIRLLRDGATELEASGDAGSAAVAMARTSSALYWEGIEGAQVAETLRGEALALLDQDEPSEALVFVLEECAVQAVRDYRYEDGILKADRAMAMSRLLGLPERPRSVAYRGTALAACGDPAGLAELRRAWELARNRGDALTADAACQMLAELTYGFDGPVAALALARQGYAHAEKRGARLSGLWLREQIVQNQRLSGEWDLALEDGLDIEASLERSAVLELGDVRLQLAHLRLLRGDLAETRRLLDQVAATSDLTVGALLTLGILRAALHRGEGDLEGARGALRLLEPGAISDHMILVLPADLSLLARTAIETGDEHLAERLSAASLPGRTVDRCVRAVVEGLLAERRGQLEVAETALAAAEHGWESLGNPWEAASASCDLSRVFIAQGRADEASARLRTACEAFGRLGAEPGLAKAHSLMSAAAT